MRATQWENKQEALTGGTRLWMTIAAAPASPALPRFFMAAIIIP